MTEMDAILTTIERSLPEPEFKARLFAMLARAGLYRHSRSSLIAYRAQAAVKLIEQGSRRAEARDLG